MKHAMPSTVQNLFTTDALAMLVGKGEYQMRTLLRHHREEFPPARFVKAWVVGNHKGYNKQRVFTAEDVVKIREVLEGIKARKKAAWRRRKLPAVGEDLWRGSDEKMRSRSRS